MSARPIDDEQIDALVRGELDREAETIDPRSRLARIQASVAAAGQPVVKTPGKWQRIRPAMWGLATAAALLLAFLVGQHAGPIQASPRQLIEEAQKTYQLPLDRCYLIEIGKDSPLLNEIDSLRSQPKVLWTRGDRFWIESTNPAHHWSWGQDERGGVWIAFGLHRAMRFDKDELPRWLRWGCETQSLRPQKLLDEVVRDFDLRREVSADGSGAVTQVVTATVKPGRRHPTLRSARLELDAETKVVRRLVLERVRQGELLATVTYTLIETQTQDDKKYQLEGHLAAPFEIYTRDKQPDKRDELLARWYGPQAAATFRKK
jgi:hypothetical protein